MVFFALCVLWFDWLWWGCGGRSFDCDLGWAIRMLGCWCGLTALESTVIVAYRKADGVDAPLHRSAAPHYIQQKPAPDETRAAHIPGRNPQDSSRFLLLDLPTVTIPDRGEQLFAILFSFLLHSLSQTLSGRGRLTEFRLSWKRPASEKFAHAERRCFEQIPWKHMDQRGHPLRSPSAALYAR